MKNGDAHVIFNGPGRLLKFYLFGEAAPRHQFVAHDVGVNDALITAGEDVYGHHCKCPPGAMYVVGKPQQQAERLPDGTVKILADDAQAYGFWFTPINDDPNGDMKLHGRDGIGFHGGGSGLPDPFADNQGWVSTYGCIRLQNVDNAQLVDSIQFVQKNGGAVFLDVVWNPA